MTAATAIRSKRSDTPWNSLPILLRRVGRRRGLAVVGNGEASRPDGRLGSIGVVGELDKVDERSGRHFGHWPADLTGRRDAVVVSVNVDDFDHVEVAARHERDGA